KLAGMFGMEAGLFCPSGTMSNQVAIRLHTLPGSEVICDRLSHIYNYEGGGIAVNSAASVRLLNGDRGRFTAYDVLQHINPDNVHFPRSSLVVVENSCNKGGGCCWELDEIKKIHAVCREKGLRMHLDGARIFNALVARNESAEEYGRLFDTVSVCLSKGLGAPVGSVLLGSATAMREGRRIRKVLGGGMRQAGFLAAAGIYALGNHIARLEKDHEHARQVSKTLRQCDYVNNVWEAETNIVLFDLKETCPVNVFLNKLLEHGIAAVEMGAHTVRMTFHLGITDEMTDEVCRILQTIK
ncbi:MAG: threonine aldolase family protein, partial [Flavobacteriales bacterium]